jgi:hypothetical protein
MATAMSGVDVERSRPFFGVQHGMSRVIIHRTENDRTAKLTGRRLMTETTLRTLSPRREVNEFPKKENFFFDINKKLLLFGNNPKGTVQ